MDSSNYSSKPSRAKEPVKLVVIDTCTFDLSDLRQRAAFNKLTEMLSKLRIRYSLRAPVEDQPNMSMEEGVRNDSATVC